MLTSRGNTFFELLLALFLLVSLQLSFAKALTYLINSTESLNRAIHAQHLLNNFLQKTEQRLDNAEGEFSAWGEQVKNEMPSAKVALNTQNASAAIRWGQADAAPCRVASDQLKGCVQVELQ